MDAIDGWILRAPLGGPTPGEREHPVTTRFLLGLPRVRRASTPSHEGERSWASSSYGKQNYLMTFEEWRLPEPSALLDVGCGDGFLTCFYGRLYPRAEVVGLDCSPEAVARARALAAMLGVDNVTFIEGDAENLDTVLAGRTFGLATARCALGCLVPVARTWSRERLDAIPAKKARQIAATIRRVLLPHGLFVSTERWQLAAQLHSWAAVLCAGGFGIDWDASRAARFGDRDCRALYVMLAARVDADARPPSLEETRTFLVGAELEAGANAAVLYGHAAQALFERLAPRRLLYGYEAMYPNGSAWRRELWEVGPLVASFDYVNDDNRELRFWPGRAAAVLESTLEREAKDLMANAWEVKTYSTPV
jgi:SAM-dependent methyltransferase